MYDFWHCPVITENLPVFQDIIEFHGDYEGTTNK